MNLLDLLQQRLREALAGLTDDPGPFAAMVRPTQDPKFGDFQANCAMPLAKQLGGNPRDVAAKIIERLRVDDFCAPPEIAGPGFINLRLRDDWLESRVNAIAGDKRLGVEPVASPKTIVVDFSSPNVAKPMHVGHLRSTVIGDALSRVLRFLGHKVITDNHVGDWGTQFGMILYGYKHFLDAEQYRRDPVGELARLYRLVNNFCDYQEAKAELPVRQRALVKQEQALRQLESSAPTDLKAKKEFDKDLKKSRRDVDAVREEVSSAERKIAAIEGDAVLHTVAASHPDIVRLSRDETAKLHAGDATNVRLWEEFVPQCLAALQRLYDRLDIRFDYTFGESYYNPRLAGVVDDLRRGGLVVESDGAQCVFIAGNEAPFIVQKADGAFTYATTDLATIRYRVDELHADEILYVVDHRQSEHFKLLFATAEKWGYGRVGLRHVVFGTVMGQDGKPYKTRSGDTVGLESLLDEAVAKALAIVSENDAAKPDGPELGDDERRSIAEVVGLGGIKYADLKHNRESDYIFDADKMLAMTGDTATYMQYAYARTRGVLRRGGIAAESLSAADGQIRITQPAERALALQLSRFQQALEAVAAESKPNFLTQYLFETANSFSGFFEQCPVLKAESEELRQSRLRLVDLTGRVIRRGLELLGIGTREKM